MICWLALRASEMRLNVVSQPLRYMYIHDTTVGARSAVASEDSSRILSTSPPN